MKGKSTRILGLWSMGESQGFHERRDPRVLKDIIKTAYRNGVDTFDSAFSYKDSDNMLASAMKEMHISEDSFHVIGKVMPVPTFRKKLDVELNRLGRTYLDTLLVHWPTEENLYEAMKDLEKALDDGKARRIGVSNFPVELIKKLMKDFPITIHERAYSPLSSRDIEREPLPLLLYGCYGFGCLLKDGRPGDRRSSLYFYSDNAYIKFLELRSLLKSLAIKYNASERVVLLSYAESALPEGIILGASSVNHAEALMDEAIIMENDDMRAIKKLGEGLESFNPSDNVFSHYWKQR